MTQQDIRVSIGRRLRTLRENKDWSQEHVARSAKCSLHFIQVLESKEPSNVSVVVLEKIAKVFDLELWQFLKFED